MALFFNSVTVVNQELEDAAPNFEQYWIFDMRILEFHEGKMNTDSEVRNIYKSSEVANIHR